MSKPYYRVDTRPFIKDGIVHSNNKFIKDATDQSVATEAVLSARQPAGAHSRGDDVFLFEERSCAEWYCAKNSKRRLYLVTVSCPILLRGDMKLLDMISSPDHDATKFDLADDYWAEKMTAKPCVEVLVKEAKVEEEIMLSAQRRREIWYENGKDKPDFSDESIDAMLNIQPKDKP